MVMASMPSRLVAFVAVSKPGWVHLPRHIFHLPSYARTSSLPTDTPLYLSFHLFFRPTFCNHPPFLPTHSPAISHTLYTSPPPFHPPYQHPLPPPLFPLMIPDDPRWSHMFPDDPRRSQMIPNNPTCFQLISDDPEESQIIPDGPTCSWMIQDDATGSQIDDPG